jgi:hypothetical protein
MEVLELNARGKRKNDARFINVESWDWRSSDGRLHGDIVELQGGRELLDLVYESLDVSGLMNQRRNESYMDLGVGGCRRVLEDLETRQGRRSEPQGYTASHLHNGTVKSVRDFELGIRVIGT